MLKVNFDASTIDRTDDLDIEIKLNRMKQYPLPSFITHKPDFKNFKKSLAKYKKYKSIIVIGNGGSVNSFRAIYGSLKSKAKKEASLLTTVEPDYIEFLKKKHSKRNTLVMAITKSGTNVAQLEAMFAFLKDSYKMLPITSDDGILSQIVKKKKLNFIMHPDIGGRFAGRSAVGFAPAMFCGIDAEEINKGCLEIYKQCSAIDAEKNPALKLSIMLYLLEKKGYTEVFVPIYSSSLAGFSTIIVQLMHESVCKNWQGQTFYTAEAPESQHHTNQRFFGGMKNVLGLFIRAENQNSKKMAVAIPKDFKALKLRSGSLADLDKVPYEKALEFEFSGTYQDAVNNKIPSIAVSVDRVDEFAVGEMLAFWQLVAMYSSWLREVNAFDQPQVESSKEISFRMRKEYKQK
jgi:glucose-6-phosphate isomerase